MRLASAQLAAAQEQVRELVATQQLSIATYVARDIDLRISTRLALIGELAADGIGIILISSDLPEVLAMSDRVLIMREGHQIAIFDRDEATQETVMTAAMGQAAVVAEDGVAA